MARPRKKTTAKVKQLVRIRFKQLANGEQSIYLDIYKEGKRAYEFLKDDNGKSLRLLVEVGTPSEIKDIRARNHKTLLQAESFRVQREKEVVELGKVENNVIPLGKMLFKDWLLQHDNLLSMLVESDAKRKKLSALTHHMKEWLGNKYNTVQMQDVDTDFCRAFLEYLREYQRQSIMHDEVIFTLSHNTVNQLFITLGNTLQRAIREGVINRNPLDGMKDNGEIPKRLTVQRSFLSVAEVSALIKTECRREDVKRAFLFSVFTGLRVSDILKLKWGEIVNDGEDLRLQVVMKKTKDPLTMKLNRQATMWLPERNDATDNDIVFSTLPTMVSVGKILQKWGKDAKIQKHFTFHTARHSFATISLNNGTDIYTISKLLGHRSLETTKVYAELLTKSKDAAVDRLSEIFKGVEGV